MTGMFVSYAQNNEDVILHRALGDVERGCYVDVGANDPVVDSVTRSFYERGWRGINIEPVPHWLARLEADRPDDVNLGLAASDRAGMLTLHDVAETGLSTLDRAVAERNAAQGYPFRRIRVAAKTLNAILKEYPREIIHFLKIDVEGAEKKVLSGINLKKHRPWIVLVEATEPRSPEENFREWEPLLTERGYRFVYFDGLNRFYLAEEKAELASAFRSPPNPFDEFVRHSEQLGRTRAAELEGALAAERELLAARQAEIAALRESWSWRLTEPFRKLADIGRRIGDRASVVAQGARRSFALLPGPGGRRRKGYDPGPVDIHELTPSARRVHGALRRAFTERAGR